MLVKVKSVANVGLESYGIDVEVDVADQGFPGFNIVGLAGKAVEEARERVKTAITNSEMQFPPKKITVNLAPADLPKDGGAYDLPIAMGILAATDHIAINNEQFAGGLFYGELSLDGSLRATKGVLLVGLFAKHENLKEIFVPVESANEAVVVDGIKVYPVRNLQELANHLKKSKLISRLESMKQSKLIETESSEFDLSEI